MTCSAVLCEIKLRDNTGLLQVSEVTVFTPDRKVLPIAIGTCVSSIMLVIIIGRKLHRDDGKSYLAFTLFACVAAFVVDT